MKNRSGTIQLNRTVVGQAASSLWPVSQSVGQSLRPPNCKMDERKLAATNTSLFGLCSRTEWILCLLRGQSSEGLLYPLGTTRSNPPPSRDTEA